MISAEAPLLLCKACELFIFDLTMRSWAHTDFSHRRTLQRSDVVDALASTEAFDFLVDLEPREEKQQHAAVTTEFIVNAFEELQKQISSSAESVQADASNTKETNNEAQKAATTTSSST